MSTTESPNLLLPYILPAQAQKHVTHNEAVRALDAIVQLAVLDRDLSAAPAIPNDGDRYIVGSAATGVWAGKSGKIAAFQDGAWAYMSPREGWVAWAADEDLLLIFNGAAWSTAGSAGPAGPTGAAGANGAAGATGSTGPAGPQGPTGLTGAAGTAGAAGAAGATGTAGATGAAGPGVPTGGIAGKVLVKATAANFDATWQDVPVNPTPLVGINATADTTNRLSVSAPATLLNNAGNGHQLKINKNAAADTASLLYQTGFSGRVEMGTTGDDNMHVKVSADGTVWKEAIVVDRTSGAATFPFGSGQTQVDVFTANGTWTKPAWARRVRFILMGGGAGGSSGRRGAAASERRGGGGGSSAGIIDEEFVAAELPATLSVDVGAGGSGGAAVAVDTTNGNAGGNGLTSAIRDGALTVLSASGGLAGTGGQSAAGGAGGSGWVGSFGASNSGGSAGSGAGAQGLYWSCGRSGGGGGAGGSLSTANVTAAGGVGGDGYWIGGASRKANSAAGGAALAAGIAGNPKAWQRGAGSGGGGGGSGDAAATIPGGTGGAGGIPGGGGGGGGGSTNTQASGAGGVGGRGEVWVISLG
jgi:Protein of unknown function (DUF2793)